jgi:hypothetical protein
MPTQLGNLPLLQWDQETGNNEDWRNSIMFMMENDIDPFDLTGILFTCHVRQDPGLLVVRLAFDSSLSPAGWLINGLGDGTISMKVPASQMRRLDPDTYEYDVVGTADGITARVITGNLVVVQGLTKL